VSGEPVMAGEEVVAARAASRRRVRAVLPSLVGLAAAVVLVVALRVSGSLQASDDTLVVMGFDPERARLITALIAGALAGAAVAAFGGRTIIAVLASLGATAAVFWPVFHSETLAALAASGPQGSFDPVGWTLSLLTLVVAAAIAGWAAATLTAVVRQTTIRAAADTADTLRGRRRGVRGLARAVSIALAVVVLAATLPIFADMVNYAPDVHMRRGAPVAAGLTGPGVSGATPASPAPSGGPGAVTVGTSVAPPLPSGLEAGPLPGALITPGAFSAARPWAAHPPTGTGQVSRITLPAPWTGGISSTANVDVYTPPGFGIGSTRYPVMYEVPYGIESWAKGVSIATMLDNLIGSGAIPPMMMVFASTYGGPYQDSECADSRDGRERFDAYMPTQLVPYIDAHYPTIANAAARAVVGASQGGYCAAALWSHHPDVFGTDISFSGYFQAGVVSSETQNAARPFGGDAAYEARQSPINIVPSIPAPAASRSFVVLSADLANAFFGPQLRDYAAVLAAAHVPMAILPAPLGHSWQTQREQLPTVLQMLAARMAQLGVFGKS
jgi:enterochelin esterase-like enzyme